MKMPWERNDGLKKGAEKFGTPVSKAKEENRGIAARLNADAKMRDKCACGETKRDQEDPRYHTPNSDRCKQIAEGRGNPESGMYRKNTGEGRGNLGEECPLCERHGIKEPHTIEKNYNGKLICPFCGRGYIPEKKNTGEAAAQSGSSSGGGVDSSATGYQQTEKTTTDDGKLKENGNADWDKNAKDADALQRQIEALLAKKDDASFKQAKELMKQKQALMDKLYTTKSLGNASDRAITQDDMNAAARGNNMLGMSVSDLRSLIADMEGKDLFAAKVTVAAAKQMLAAKKRMGAAENASDEDFKSKCAACNSLSDKPWSGKCGNCLANYDGEENGEKKEKSNDIPPPQGEPWDQESYNGKDQGERVNGEDVRCSYCDALMAKNKARQTASGKPICYECATGKRYNSDEPRQPIAEDAGKTGETIRGVENAGHLAAEPWSVASDDERMGWLLSAGQDADLARFEWTDISMDAQKALQDVWDMPASRNEPGADPEGADGRGQTTPVQDRNFADEPVIRADMSRDGEVVNAKGDACPSCGSNETFEFKGAHGDNMACSICDRTWGATRKNASDTEEKLKKAGFAWTTSGSGDAYIIYRAGRDPQASMVADSKISLEDAAKKVLKNASDYWDEHAGVRGEAGPRCKKCEGAVGKDRYCPFCKKTLSADQIHNPSTPKKNASDTGLCYDCSHPGTAHNPTCEGEGGKPCSLNCKHFVKRDSDGGPNKPRKNASSQVCKCEGAGPHAAGEVRRMDYGGGTGFNLCRKCWDAMNKHARKGDFEPKDWNSGQVLNSITGTEITLKLKGRRNAGVATGEAKYGSRENAKSVPADFPVRPLKAGEKAEKKSTCGSCNRSWDDAKITSMTPAPGGRCPFEEFH